MLNKLQHILLGIVVLALVRVFMLAVPGSMEENHAHALFKKASGTELLTLSAISDCEDDDESDRKKIKTGYAELPVQFSYHTLFIAGNPCYIFSLKDTPIALDNLSSYICCWRI